MSSIKKSQESTLKILRDLASLDENRFCFECNQRGPTYINISIGSFICTGCGGALRKYNQRIKSISMSNFSQEEINFLKRRGNKACQKIYMALYKESAPPEKGEYFDDFLRQKYEIKKWYQEPSAELEKTTMTENQEMLSRISETPVQKNNRYGTNASSGLIILPNRSLSSVTSTPSLAVSSKLSANSLSNISCPGLTAEPLSISQQHQQQQQVKPIPPPERPQTKPNTDPFSSIGNSSVTNQPTSLYSFASFDSSEAPKNPFMVNQTPKETFSATVSEKDRFFDLFNSTQKSPSIKSISQPTGYPPPVTAEKYAALAELDGLRKMSDVPTTRPMAHSNDPQFSATFAIPILTVRDDTHMNAPTGFMSSPYAQSTHLQTNNPFNYSTSAFSPPTLANSFDAATCIPRSSTTNPFITTAFPRATANPFTSVPPSSRSSHNPFINSG